MCKPKLKNALIIESLPYLESASSKDSKGNPFGTPVDPRRIHKIVDRPSKSCPNMKLSHIPDFHIFHISGVLVAKCRFSTAGRGHAGPARATRGLEIWFWHCLGGEKHVS